VTATPVVGSTFRATGFLIGALIALVGHGLTFAAGFTAGRTVTPSPGGGLEDLGAGVAAFLGGQLALAVGCFVAWVVLVARRRTDIAVGLITTWVLGAVGLLVYIMS
jgi:hypothetical protein